MRWLYIKNGDAVAQLKRVGALPESVPEAGPDAFIADFLSGIGGQPALVISWCGQNDEWTGGPVRARVHRVAGSRAGRPGNALLRIAATIAVAREILAFRPDRIICGRVGPALWVTAMVARWLGCPFVHSRHNSLYESQARWYQRFLSKFDVAAIRAARGVICHGPYLVRQMREIGVPAARIFEFDVGFSRFQEAAAISRQSASSGQDKTVLYVGRIERNKGVFDLLAALEPLLERDKNIKLRYVGDGRDLDSLRNVVSQKGLSARIECLGRVGHEALPGIIASAFVLVTPTRREFPEGRCMAAMEALACGVPVVAPDYGPFPYLVKSEVNGLLYQSDDVSALGGMIRRMVSDPELYMRLHAGAAQTAATLRLPLRGFYQAVQQAFDD